ncbi:MAG: hypothetical protein AB8B53_13615 [Flavobacteriales bacterium]
MKKILLLLLSFFVFTAIYSQRKSDLKAQSISYSMFNSDEETEDEEYEDSNRGFTFGIDLGVYFANKKTSNIYNGNISAFDGDLENAQGVWFTVAERFNLNPNLRSQLIQTINDEYPEYNQTVTDFVIDDLDYSYDMNYQPRLYFALNATYHLSDYWAIVAKSSLANLKANAVYTMTLIGPLPPQNASEVIEQFDISGEEQRLHLDLGFKNTSYNDYGFQWFWGGGMSLVGAKVEANTAFIGERAFPLILRNNGNFQLPQEFDATQPSYNIGFYATTGFEMEYQDRYTFGIGFNLSRDPIELGTYKEDVWNSRVFITFGI